MPPWASGPVFTVSRPSRNGSACATAGAGKRVNAAAAPATPPASTVRRLTLRVFGLADIPRPPFFPVWPATANGRALRQPFLNTPVPRWRLSLARQIDLSPLSTRFFNTGAAFLLSQRDQIIALAERYKLPAIR